MIQILTISLLGTLLLWPVAVRWRRWNGWILALLPAALFIWFALAGLGADGPPGIVPGPQWIPSLGIALDFRLDGFSLLFALLVTGIGTLVTIYAGAYFASAPARTSARFLVLILLFLTAMLGTVLADDLVVMFLFWEATSLLSFMLIGFESERAAARKAALQSLVVTAGGGLALFAGILLIGMELGTFSMSALAGRAGELGDSPLAVPIMLLVLAGAFTKSAQFPFHFWLPAAMEAPTPASAFLHSATMVKLGVYLLARFDTILGEVPGFGAILLTAGAVTMLVASIRALSARGFKPLLAESTVASLGLLVMLIGLDHPDASVAVVAFILAHALYKATLFFCAGTVIHAVHEGRLTRLGGLGRVLPWTAAAAAVAAVGMAGLPPAFAFIAKEQVFEAQLGASVMWLVIAATVVANAVFVAIAAVSAWKPFWSRDGGTLEVAHGESAGLVAGPVVLASSGLLAGLAPQLLAPLVSAAAGAIAGTPIEVSLSLWHGVTPMLGLSALVVSLGIATFLFWQRIQRHLPPEGTLVRTLGDGGYRWLFDGTLRLAAASTRVLQNGDQRRYSAVVMTSVTLIVLGGVLLGSPPLALDLLGGHFDPRSAVVLVLMALGAVAATRVVSLLGTLLAVGVVGFGSALIFLFNGAPDVALTQFSVEVLLVVIIAALLLRVPNPTASTRTCNERRRDAVVAGGIGCVVFLALASLTTIPLDMRMSEYFAQASYLEAYGRNVVNVILVDFRAVDTLGEISVIAFAALATWGLLRATRRSGRSPR